MKKGTLKKVANITEHLTVDKKSQGRKGMNFEEINFNFTVFSMFLGLTFAYLVFFFHQAAENQSIISSKIVEMNAISLPNSTNFLTFKGHKEYYYLRRKEVLLNEFDQLNKIIQNTSDTKLLATAGAEIQRCITQIAFFFPYKRLIEFNKDGTGRVGFFGHSIENNISMEFLKTQMEEINDLNNRFTFQLKEGKHKISMAMALANTSLDASTRDQVPKYIDRLIEYLENHQKLAIPLGVTIKKYEFLMEKVVRWKVVLISVILLSCFIIGVVIPMFLDIGKLSSLVTVSLFFIGISLLFYDAIISKSIPSIKPQSVESEFQNKEHIARGLPENGEELPWTEYNINVSQHLPSCVKEKIMMLGARHELTDFGGIPKYLGISLNHSVEIGKLKLLLSILKDCSVQLDYISYNKFDVGPTVGLGRTITVGGFNYKHGPVTRVDHFLLSKLLDPNTTQKDLERLLISGYTFKQD